MKKINYKPSEGVISMMRAGFFGPFFTDLVLGQKLKNGSITLKMDFKLKPKIKEIEIFLKSAIVKKNVKQ